MGISRIARVVIPVAAALLVASCSGEPDAPAASSQPSSSASSTASSTPSSSSSVPGGRPTTAPEVTRTLDASLLANEPCAAIEPESLEKLGVPTQAKPRDNENGRACMWGKDAAYPQLTIAFATKGDLFGEAYSHSALPAEPGGSTPRWALFEPITVLDQPAVKYAQKADGSGSCDVVVGLGGGQAIDVTSAISAKTGDQCATAIAIAEQLVDGLVQ